MRTAMLSLAFFLVSACAGSNPLQPDVPFRAIGVGGKQSASSGVLVIRTAAEWEPFLRETSLRAPSGNPDDPLPAVDFSSEMVVALFLGQRPTTGYRISVDRVTREGSGLQIAAVERPNARQPIEPRRPRWRQHAPAQQPHTTRGEICNQRLHGAPCHQHAAVRF